MWLAHNEWQMPPISYATRSRILKFAMRVLLPFVDAPKCSYVRYICNGKTVNKVTAPGKAISLRKIYIYIEVEENKTNKNRDSIRS